MGWFKDWISGICVITVIVAIAKGAVPQNPSGKLVAVVGTVLIIFSVISPVLRLDFDEMESVFERYNSAYEEAASDVKRENEKICGEIIEKKLEEYISEEASYIGVKCKAVKVTVKNDNEKSVRITKAVIECEDKTDYEKKKALKKMLNDKLNIDGNTLTFK